jgi:hypothetical protein
VQDRDTAKFVYAEAWRQYAHEDNLAAKVAEIRAMIRQS